MFIICTPCTNEASGQKGRVVLKTQMDSVSYSMGADIGKNLMQQMPQELLDTLNNAALAEGIHDALDSTERMSDEKISSMVQDYMVEVQKRALAEEQAEGEQNLREGEAWLSENDKKPGVITTPSGLQYEVLQKGTGATPTAESTVKVNYKGTLLDGSEFDSSYKRGTPAEFGVGNVIPGWTEALQLMKEGSKWELVIPPTLAYGDRGAPPVIPPNSALVFEVELLKVGE